MLNPGGTPVGSVLMYAGPINAMSSRNLMANGWLPCDGSLYPSSQFPELYAVVQSGYGKVKQSFAVPYYGGLFIRGVDGGAGRDPDSASRMAPRPDLASPGNAGNQVGSLQMDQMQAHSHGFDYFSNALASTRTTMESCISGQTTASMSAAGGAETRPLNQYVNFIIKAISSPDIVPLGAVIPFAGDANKAGQALRAAGWWPCAGDRAQITDLQQLYRIIGQRYGADDQASFRLPDYRGQFLRGVQGALLPGQSQPMDPDNQSRAAPNPNLPRPGNAGDHVGSVQDSLFVAHTHSYTTYADSWDITGTLIGNQVEANGSPVTWVSGQNSALAESRPANIGVNYLIRTLP